MSQTGAHDPYAALRYRDYRYFAIGSNLSVIGRQMAGVAIAWELYQRTGQAISLGWVGLTHAAPVILLALPAGQIADRFNRKKLTLLGQVIVALSSVGLAAVSALHAPTPWIYLCIFIGSLAGAFSGPARGALLPQLVPENLLSNAVTWNSGAFQVASMLGPALGGGLISLLRNRGEWPVYLIDAVLEMVFFVAVALLHNTGAVERRTGRVTLKELAAGIQFVRRTRMILATITLDLFAVLLGGAVALLPIYARDILKVGPAGYGALQAAPSAGAMIMAMTLAHVPMRRAGLSLLWAVAGFGAATIVFGISHSFWLSLLMLCLTGALDNISVVVRHSLVLLLTPDAMRGRVNAVNNVFISSSNDLGGFESSAVAQYFGPVVSVVSGGVGTTLVVLLIALIWPEVRRFGSLHDARPE